MKDGQIVLVSGIKEANKKIKMVVALETVSTILIFIEKYLRLRVWKDKNLKL